MWVRAASLWIPAVALAVLAFPPFGLWPLAVVMLAPVAAFAEDARPGRTFLFAYAWSVAMGVGIVHWLVHALAVEYGVASPAAWSVMALLVGTFALVPAAAVACHAALRQRVAAGAAPLVFAALWTLGEWVRADPLGLPWVLAAQPLAFVPLAIQSAELGGTHLPGLVVAALGGGLGIAVRRRDARVLLGPALLAAAVLVYGAARLGSEADGGPPVRVGVVQASLPPAQRFRPGSALRNTRRHVALSRRLVAEQDLDLLVWSETAVDEDLDRAPRLEALLHELVDASGVPLVTGAPLVDEGGPRNAAVLVRPGRPGLDRYHKQRLVPLSEYEPRWLAWLSPLLPELTEGRPYLPGDAPALLEAAPAVLAAPICFEITYPHLVRRFRERGAGIILNLSNDAWFGRTGYARLHLSHAVFRAVELRSWVVRATNTGISAVIDPRGRVVAALPLFQEGTLAATVRSNDTRTFYGRFGDAPVLALLATIPLAALGWPRGRSGRARAVGAAPRS